MHLEEINEVIKASPAIQVQGKMTHLQRRAWNVLLANAYDELPNREIHRVSVAELAKSLGFNSHNEDHLKETLKALVDYTVEWNVLGKDKKQEWGVASLLGSARIKDGVCTYSFAAHLRYKLYNPRIYTKLNLRLQNRFTHRYALILWEVCFDYFDIARNQGETPFIPMETFRDLMGLDKDEYPLFKEFNRNVIKPAIQEINALTNFFIEIEPKRIGRKICELKFRISRLKEMPTVQPTQETFSFDIEDLPPSLLNWSKREFHGKRHSGLRTKHGMRWMRGQSPRRAEILLCMLKRKSGWHNRRRMSKNMGGFIVKAIRENYEDPVFRKELQVRKAEERKAMLASLRTEMLEKRNALIRQAVRARPELLEQAAAKIMSLHQGAVDGV